MSIRKDLNIICEAAMNEGAGAAVTFHFNKNDRDYRIDVDFDCKDFEILVGNLIISDYYYSEKCYDGGKFVFTEEDLKKGVVYDHNEYSGDAENPITIEDIKSVKITGVEEMPNLSCSWGWVRTDIPEEMVISEAGNGYTAVLEVEADINGEKTYYTINSDGKYIPSEEVKVAYDNLGEESEEEEE